ncbi:hypothetical protein FIBSPDRAFT_753124 [Athelia psychrophila]|uniref:DUF7330 domain-containing protein n=1 Tax=Athelia psychrophila TaxID=1759441 RepID=A0A167UZ54_9AGAM|nr:hypothetical protein FIBSPDRAFT_767428 [Fibularhizoctonia sp. CBS 109695]KZP13600.1 hypothetical protein FIBSPDRAFT_753124 [Fibularhizoctonia sp. CBS 109695]
MYEADSPAPLQTTSGATIMRPTNYLMLERKQNPIKGQYAIDPSISIPQSLLPLLPAGTKESDRKNVMLKSAKKIDVDIALLNPRHPMGKPTTLTLESTHGSVNLQLRTTPADPLRRAPFNATITATYGSATIWLPADFQGLVSIYTLYGSVKISNKFLEHVTLRHEAEHTERLFVGDLTALSEQDSNFRDEVYVSAQHGVVRVCFLDEEDQHKKRFFVRMFGR